MKKIIFLLITIISIQNTFAQTGKQKELRKEMDEFFWGKNAPYTDVVDIPEKYKNESAVIIYKYQDYDYHNQKVKVEFTEKKRLRIKIQDQNFGNHVEHWNLLTDTPETDVPKWLGLALDAPVMPMGLCEDEQEMDQSFWLIQGPSGQAISINQIIAVEDQKPRTLKTAFPSFESPYKYEANIERLLPVIRLPKPYYV